MNDSQEFGNGGIYHQQYLKRKAKQNNPILQKTSLGNYVHLGKKLPATEKSLILDLYFQNKTSDEIASYVRRDIRTVEKYISNYLQDVEPQQGRPIGCTAKSDEAIIQFVKLMLDTNPSIRIMDIVFGIYEEFQINVSHSHVYNIITKVLKYSYKRVNLLARQRISEEVQYYRKLWRDNIFSENISSFIFLDETHFDYRSNNPHYGWFEKGTEPTIVGSYFERQSWSLLAAISIGGFHHYSVVNTEHSNGVKKPRFLSYLEELILSIPEDMRSRVTIIMDNAKVHVCNSCKLLLHQYQVDYIFLPKYSPDYNAIELVFGEIKKLYRKSFSDYLDIPELVDWIITQIPLNSIIQAINKTISNWRTESV